VSKLLATCKAEYAFYDIRYKYALEKLFHSIHEEQQGSSPDKKAIIQKYLSFTVMLNQRLNDLIQLVDAISNDMVASSNKMEKEIKDANHLMQEKKKKLEYQHNMITSNEATMKIRKEMVKYTEQKARSSDNLLKLYSFLNIVALGLLVYVYKAVDD
jgi:hypothetical protein